MKNWIIAAALAATPLAGAQAQDAVTPALSAEARDQLDQVLRGEWRSKDSARDVYRHPAETLAFFDVEPDMTVVEYAPGGGWYSDILAPYLAEKGRFIAVQLPDAEGVPEGYRKNAAAGAAAFPGKLAERTGLSADGIPSYVGGDLPESLDDAVDRVLVIRMMHNLMRWGVADRELAEWRRVLKPGGRLISIDFTRPHWLIQRAYYLYLCRGLPAIGRAISPEWDDTFEYLWRSILRFHEVPHVVDTVKAAGFHKVATRSLTGGIATLISGTRT